MPVSTHECISNRIKCVYRIYHLRYLDPAAGLTLHSINRSSAICPRTCLFNRSISRKRMGAKGGGGGGGQNGKRDRNWAGPQSIWSDLQNSISYLKCQLSFSIAAFQRITTPSQRLCPSSLSIRVWMYVNVMAVETESEICPEHRTYVEAGTIRILKLSLCRHDSTATADELVHRPLLDAKCIQHFRLCCSRSSARSPCMTLPASLAV